MAGCRCIGVIAWKLPWKPLLRAFVKA